MRREHRPSFTLIELLVVLICRVALSFSAVLLVAAMRVDQVAAATQERVTRHAVGADLFREDVGRARQSLANHGEYVRGSGCLILQIGEKEWVIYRVQGEVLERIAKSDEAETRQSLLLGGLAEFAQSDGARPTITLRLREAPPRKPFVALELVAVLGSDRR